MREPQKPVAEINARYAPSKDETDLGLKPAPAAWLAGYAFFDAAVFDAPDQWREFQVLDWFLQFGHEHFDALDIWDVDWNFSAAPASPPATQQPAPVDLASGFIALADQEFNAGRLAAARDHLERAVDVASTARIPIGNRQRPRVKVSVASKRPIRRKYATTVIK